MASDTPVGMVDSLLDQEGGVTEDALAFARAYMAEGEMDPQVVARIRDPEQIALRAQARAELRERDWAALSHYRRANAALQGQPVDVVFLGDSITEMWGVAQPDLFTGGVVNRGISGQTSPQMLVRFMPDVIALKPRAVHIMGGVNDIAGNTGPTTPQDYRNNILAMLDLARAHGVTVILASIAPIIGLTWTPGVLRPRERVAELNAWIAETAAARGLIHADYVPVLSDEDGALRPEFTRDGVHPRSAGYAAMRPVTDAALQKALGQGL